ncbi:MAG TPA: (d)CMP kinase, partial [Anaerovoracaceae bacterium]|nr:(d)CMP kinase [Anaerovoracaceae bacterium]
MRPEIFQIAIDGPSGAGKSTIAKGLANRLNIDYVDTGAMYRAVGYAIQKESISLADKKALDTLLDNIKIDIKKNHIVLNGNDISHEIRTPEITRISSEVSAWPEVRNKLVALQQNMGKHKSLVLDGRDIGTNVFPRAKYKYFITASVEERSKRRWIELTNQGREIDIETVRKDIETRDYNDMHRDLNPLIKARDAVEIDTTHMGIEQVIEK